MVERKTGSFKLMKSLNRSLILNIIRSNDPISRADIAKKTGLTPPTVGNLVKELIESGLVVESSQGESKGGRKPTLLTMNATSNYVVGLDVGPSTIKIVLIDLNGALIESFQTPISIHVTNASLLDQLSETITKLLKKQLHINKEKIVGIGVGMHGIVDSEHGLSIYAPNLQLRDISIKQYLEEQFDILVKVENDVRAMALGETWFGAGRNQRSVVCINVGRGIGAGIILNGELFHGENYIAGEIGHMTVDIDGPKCSCGNYGCLQALASGPSLVEKIAKEIGMGKKSLLTNIVHDDLSKINGELVYEAATQGDPLSIDVLYQTGVYLGIGITNLIHILNPDQIILGGGVAKAGDFILEPLKATVDQRALTPKAKQTNIQLSVLGDQATAIGAASLLLTELFSSES